MRDYSKGKIYTIRNNNNNNLIYVGSTIEEYLSKRFQKHKHHYECSLYKYISNPSNNTNWNEWYIELYEEYPCQNKLQLCKRENEVIRQIATINKNGFSTEESVKQYRKDWTAANKAVLQEKSKIYREINREDILRKKRDYNEANREKKNNWGKEKVSCECGCVCSKGNLRRHRKSQEHLNFEKNQNEKLN